MTRIGLTYHQPSRWRFGWMAAVLFAAMVHDAEALDFSAERIMKSGTTVVTAHVNAKDDRWRMELAQPQDEASIIIVRTDLKTSWLILSKRRQYLEVPIAREHRVNMRETMDGELARDFVGAQTLNGYPTELFEVTVAEDGGSRQYYQWVTKTQRFPVKTVSKQGDWSEEYRHLVFAEQSFMLFELPQRLDRAAPPGSRQRETAQ